MHYIFKIKLINIEKMDFKLIYLQTQKRTTIFNLYRK